MTAKAYVRLTLIVVLSFLLTRDTAGEDTKRPSKSGDRSPLILAHYMPWYTAKPFSDRWGWHWTMNHFDPEKQSDGQRQIAAKYYPLIGPYDSGDPHVLEYHLLLMKLAGIDGVIVDWYGLTNYRDYAILHHNTTRLLQQCERLKMKFVICYEDQTIPILVKGKRLKAADRVSHAVNEIDWLGKYWFKSHSYVQLNGHPVLLSFGHNGLTVKEWSDCLSRLKSPISYFSENIRRPGAMGGFDWPAPNVGLQQVSQFLTLSSKWPAAIPAAYPRFDDIYREAKVSRGFPKIPDQNGRTLRSTLKKAIQSKANIVQIATWNDWGEGTQIEPSREFGYRDLEAIQTLRGKYDKNHLAFKPADLRLPMQVFKLRRDSNNDTERLDRISSWLVAGKTNEVKMALARDAQ
ncbi:MAG: hypothetical protein CMJ78_13350 [Planctomycetaceae bacterium]|nr:hypothetical protein [Planctomycetaceae bacterium]